MRVMSRMKIYNISVSKPGVSECEPYIYIIYTIDPEAYVYVGETEDLNGALGRLAGHIKIQKPGTFITKFAENSALDISVLSDIRMIAFDVSEYQIFSGAVNKTKRRALEYLLHFKILGFSCDDSILMPYTVISHVQAQERYISDVKIKEICDELFNEAFKLLPYNKEAM